jgi:osmotically inducible protein OsmC
MRTLADRSSPPHPPLLCTGTGRLQSPIPHARDQQSTTCPATAGISNHTFSFVKGVPPTDYGQLPTDRWKNVDSSGSQSLCLRLSRQMVTVKRDASVVDSPSSHLFSSKSPAIPAFSPNPTSTSHQNVDSLLDHCPAENSLGLAGFGYWAFSPLSLQKNNSVFASSGVCVLGLSSITSSVLRSHAGGGAKEDVFVVNFPFRRPNVDSTLVAHPKFQKKPVNPRPPFATTLREANVNSGQLTRGGLGKSHRTSILGITIAAGLGSLKFNFRPIPASTIPQISFGCRRPGFTLHCSPKKEGINMADIQRTGRAQWNGGLKDGQGKTSTGSGQIKDLAYSVPSRFESGQGTNPEEMIAAAHASCFSMMLAKILGDQNKTAQQISTSATLTLDPARAKITKIHLVTEAKVPGMDAESFKKAADEAKQKCPVSVLLNPGLESLTLDAKLA